MYPVQNKWHRRLLCCTEWLFFKYAYVIHNKVSFTFVLEGTGQIHEFVLGNRSLVIEYGEYGVFRFGHHKNSWSLLYVDWLNIKTIFVLNSNECKNNSPLHTHTHTQRSVHSSNYKQITNHSEAVCHPHPALHANAITHHYHLLLNPSHAAIHNHSLNFWCYMKSNNQALQ